MYQRHIPVQQYALVCYLCSSTCIAKSPLYLVPGTWYVTRNLKTCQYDVYFFEPVAPVAYQVILEHGIGQLREFEPRRVHTRINSLGLFLVHNLTCGKRESVS